MYSPTRKNLESVTSMLKSIQENGIYVISKVELTELLGGDILDKEITKFVCKLWRSLFDSFKTVPILRMSPLGSKCVFMVIVSTEYIFV
jgi:hypothetical protein